MQKIKALGFNTVSFYTLWGLHNPSEGDLDFDGWKNLQPFIDAAKESGLWMIARPGPYIVSRVQDLLLMKSQRGGDVGNRVCGNT
jgi:beta-galactosidase GanA